MTDPRFNKPLIVAGATLFLLGLLQGAAVQQFLNPRMALSAHLTAVQSGMALMIAGAVWQAVTLPPSLARLCRWALMVSMFALWSGLTLSAMTGASVSLPIAGSGFSATPGMELFVSALVLGSSGVMVLGWGLLVIGLVRWRPT
ncbi:MAG: hypothetical protein ABIT10_05115 [Alteraurantiacibacter sp.]